MVFSDLDVLWIPRRLPAGSRKSTGDGLGNRETVKNRYSIKKEGN